MLGSGVENGGVWGDKSAKPVTTVWARVSTFLNVKPLDVFKETSGQFPTVFVVTEKNDIF